MPVMQPPRPCSTTMADTAMLCSEACFGYQVDLHKDLAPAQQAPEYWPDIVMRPILSGLASRVLSPPDASSPASTGEAEAALGMLRAKLDTIDDALHDLLIQRAETVRSIATTKSGVSIRPGREAAIIRRLLGRHQGQFPEQTIIRIWRELFAGSNSMQRNFTVSVCDSDDGSAAMTQIAREHFGALTPLRIYGSPAQAIADVSSGQTMVAVVPAPVDDESPRAAWWTALLHHDAPRIHIVARLPVWNPRPEGAPRADAMAVAAIAPDPSGNDRALLGLEIASDISRARLTQMLINAGFSVGNTILRRIPGADDAHVLADVAGFVEDSDPRLAALTPLLRPPVVLGCYAVPVPASQAGSTA
ncbi:Chorismate mutase [Granulibacter bethesdensis]|nr:Chorismate mutase [Granulibacter bethesdensis]